MISDFFLVRLARDKGSAGCFLRVKWVGVGGRLFTVSWGLFHSYVAWERVSVLLGFWLGFFLVAFGGWRCFHVWMG